VLMWSLCMHLLRRRALLHGASSRLLPAAQVCIRQRARKQGGPAASSLCQRPSAGSAVQSKPGIRMLKR